MKQRISQKEAIFYRLYLHFKSPKSANLVPVFELMGEVWCEPVKKWGFVSYEVSARASEMMKENPGLILRDWIRGKSGAKYYGYRFSPAAKPELIKDQKLVAFYRTIGGKKVESEHEKMMRENRQRLKEFDEMP